MNHSHEKRLSPRLVWVSTITPSTTLDSATWLDTTRELRRLGWHVTLIGMGPSGRQRVRNVEILCLPRPQIYFLGMWVYHLYVLRILTQEWSQADVFLFHQISALWLLPLRFVRWLKGQQQPLLIMDTRDLVDLSRGDLRRWMRRLHSRLAYWFAAYLADGQTTITKRMAQLVHIPSQQLLGIWPSGVDLDPYYSVHASRHWPKAKEPIHLIYIGVFEKKRNLSLLCRVVEQANEKGMHFVFTLVGTGVERTNLELFAQNLPEQIRVLAPIPHDQVPDLLGQAHVGVTSLPGVHEAKYQASSPIKLFEYMAAGIPILATSNPCHAEVVGNGTYAFWVDSADEPALLAALGQIWHCRTNLAQMGAEAAAAAHYWTWSASAKKLSLALKRGVARKYAVQNGVIVK